MSGRPFVSKGIQELEKQFVSRQGEQTFLQNLIHELSFRKTKRAQTLASRAQAALNGAHRTSPVKPTAVPGSSSSKASPSVQRSATAPPPVSPPPRPKPKFRATPRTQIDNRPQDVLAAWTAMEVLSPSVYRSPEDLAAGDRRRVAELGGGSLPWENGGERSRPKYRLYYQVVLGSILMEPAVSALLEVYTDARPERPQVRGNAVLASVMVDKEGRPVENDPVAISSFGWAVPHALAGELETLSDWSEAERALTKQLSEKIIRKDRDGALVPLTAETIRQAYSWLLEALGLDPGLTEPPDLAIRTYQYFQIQDPPEAMILNSFFLDDLAAAGGLVRQGKSPGNLERYLGVKTPESRRDLLRDKQAIEHALEPAKFPLAGWPGKGRHMLAMLQQCAVNLALHDLKQEGILAVNGPPGTGKTTLLRDIIAGVVTERAEAMVSYSDPEKAFSHSGQKIKKGNAFIHLYELDERVRGFEMIVASSNNKAVENVSAELPGLGAVAADAKDLRYFSTVAHNLLKKDSWGAIAAVLGNAANRASFRQDFWWDQDRGLQTYLQHASGNPKIVKDETTSAQRPPLISQRENPPQNHDEALSRWREVRRRFTQKLEEAQHCLDELQSAYELNQSIRAQQASIDWRDRDIAEARSRQHQAKTELTRLEGDLAAAHSRLDEATAKLVRSKRAKPGLLRRLFYWSEYRSWRAAHGEMAHHHRRAQAEHKAIEAEREQHRETLAEIEARIGKLQALKETEQSKLDQDKTAYAALADLLGGAFIDDAFFGKDHRGRQLTGPWLSEMAARIRQELFEVSMQVHKAFIDAAAKPIRHNLNVLLDSFGTRPLGSPEKDALIPHLWATLFLVVPVVSTTFASVSRMFGRIGPEAFGWLLIDEAGQALPQAAVGALLRTKRAVVVGDPIQIEPVVVLPNSLTEAICKQFGIDPLIYNAPEASAQTLADSATAYYGSFETQFGTREVGVPLLVHRRCAEPMFSISNAVGYENLMVQAKADGASGIRDVLGPSRWIHVQGGAQEKWCPEEGQAVLDLLRELRKSGTQPDLYIVTPFVVVQNTLRTLLRSSGVLDGWVESSAWVYEHVGTVHTVQGREAEAVIFVLGAPLPEQRGARAWAGGRPNLLNVATTRAKEVLYVVGNKELWRTTGVFSVLSAQLGH